ncbi:MAG: hypothetical protein U0Q11_20395 [Vicinamibacterales bacterium]
MKGADRSTREPESGGSSRISNDAGSQADNAQRSAHAVQQAAPCIAWLLDADPAIRWQVLQDLTDAPPEAVAAERARVATEGLGAQLLAQQASDGRWNNAAWNRGWNSTMHALLLLRDLGLDPASEAARHAAGLVRDNVTWVGCAPPECHSHPFFAGEVEPCINGQVALAGAYFRQDTTPIVERLLNEQLPDGGWNCDAENGSTRSSFNTTICALEALLAYEQNLAARSDVRDARLRGEAYLLERHLFHRRSTGTPIEYDRKMGPASSPGVPAFTRLAFPTWWHYDVLRALEYFRLAGASPDPRMKAAVDLVTSKRNADGRWSMEVVYPGVMPIDLGETIRRPSRWLTLRALRVLRWYRASA